MTAAASDFGKREILIVDLDLDICSLVHSTSPCTAARLDGGECYNTWGTCQDRPNYDKTAKRYRFTLADGPNLPGVYAFRCLRSITTIPGEIREGQGIAGRGQVTIEAADFSHDDTGIDPYAINRPGSGSKFFAKLLARNQNFAGRPAYVRTGWLEPDGSFLEANLTTRRYILDDMKIGKGGAVRIVLRDLLKLADQSTYPVQTDGKLAAVLTVGATSCSVGSGEGAQYGTAPFYVRIDNEIILVNTRSTDSFSSITRAQAGTTAAEHSADTRVELWGHLSDTVDVVWSTLLQAAGIDAGLIDTTEAETETDTWFSQPVEAFFPPTQVTKLVSDLCLHVGALTWWDPLEQKARMAFRHPLLPGEVSDATLTDAASIVSDSVYLETYPDERRTRVVWYYGVEDWSLKVADQDRDRPAFRGTAVVIDADAESEQEFDDVRELAVYAYWIPESLGAEARSIAFRTSARLRNIPRRVVMSIDRKDADTLGLWAPVDVETRVMVDTGGNVQTIEGRVTKIHPPKPGESAVAVTIEDTRFDGILWATYAPDGTADYPTDTTYAHYADSSGLMSDGTDGYVYV